MNSNVWWHQPFNNRNFFDIEFKVYKHSTYVVMVMYPIQQQKHIFEETSQKAQHGCWNSMINWYKRDYFEGQQLKLLQAVDYFKCDWRLEQLFTRCCYLTAFATCRHLPPVWRSFVILSLDRKKIHRSLVWKLAANYKANQSWDLGPMQKFCYQIFCKNNAVQSSLLIS